MELGQIVMQRFGTGNEGALCEVKSSCDAPTFSLVTNLGHEFTWRQDLTRPATEAETILYWKNRAIEAESLLARATELADRAATKALELAEEKLSRATNA